MMRIFPLLLLFLVEKSQGNQAPVYILAENLQQVRTSSTLQWKQFTGEENDFENAVIGAYEILPGK